MDAERVIAETLSWVGTPYRHQAGTKGVGCDCIGLVRGVWSALYGYAPDMPADYAPDWSCGDAGEAMLAGARRLLHECRAGGPFRGRVLVFRWRPHLPARHASIAISEDSFVHAYEGGRAVVKSALVPQWGRRIAGVFAFPDN